MTNALRVTIWNEGRHEQIHEAVKKVYPDGMGNTIAKGLQEYGYTTRVATFDDPEHGLTEDVLAQTDVLTWWGHMLHNDVRDDIVDRVQKAVLNGMGLIVLHSGHESKIFKRLMGTSCDLKWREATDTERLWVADPGHPIVEGIGDYIGKAAVDLLLREINKSGDPFQTVTVGTQLIVRESTASPSR